MRRFFDVLFKAFILIHAKRPLFEYQNSGLVIYQLLKLNQSFHPRNLSYKSFCRARNVFKQIKFD